MYCFGGNHRCSLFEDLWETLGATFGAILGATLDANFGRKKSFNFFFWDSNPGQIDDFHLMRLFCLSIYIRNIPYWTTVIQRYKKKTENPLRTSKRTVCCFSEGIPLNLLTLIQVSDILSGTQSGNQLANRLGLCSRSGLPVIAETASTCWVFTSNYFMLIMIQELNYYAVPRLLICSLSWYWPEEACVRYVETRGALNSRLIQGISQLLLMIQSVQLQKLSIICFLSKKS